MTNVETSSSAPLSAVERMYLLHPWLAEIGLAPGDLQQWVGVELLEGDALIARIRQQGAYKARFPGIRRPDGTLRASEGEYSRQNEEYRKVFREFGDPSSRFDQPDDFAALWENEIDVNELRERYLVYDSLEHSSGDIRSAFYVYGGINLSTDDLYRALTDSRSSQELATQYNEAVAQNPLDYRTFIERATTAGLSEVTRRLELLEKDGISTAQALTAVRNINPQFAMEMTDLLYHGGNPTGRSFLSLSQLQQAQKYAIVGATASAEGFALPSKARLDALRNAGVTAGSAAQAFGQFAGAGDRIQAQVQRLRRHGVDSFGVEDYEKAVLLGRGTESELLRQAEAREESLGMGSGAGVFSQGQFGNLMQSGFKR